MPTYFTPSEGIAREVIQADLCRYLGNDATMRVGDHNGTPGYFITAFRPFTGNMLADLKADSSRWQEEARSTRIPEYTRSQVHASRSYWGPTEAGGAAPAPAPATATYQQPAAQQHQTQQSRQYSASGYPQAAQSTQGGRGSTTTTSYGYANPNTNVPNQQSASPAQAYDSYGRPVTNPSTQPAGATHYSAPGRDAYGASAPGRDAYGYSTQQQPSYSAQSAAPSQPGGYATYSFPPQGGPATVPRTHAPNESPRDDENERDGGAPGENPISAPARREDDFRYRR